MRHNVHRQARLDELLRVIALVRAQRDSGLFVKHGLLGIKNYGLGRLALGVAVCPRDDSTGNQAVTVVAQRVAHEAQLTGRFSRAFRLNDFDP